MKKTIVALLVAMGVAVPAMGVDIHRYGGEDAIQDSLNSVRGAIENLGATYDYYNFWAVEPAAESNLRAQDHISSLYFQGTWTIVHDANIKGEATFFDLSSGSVNDSLTVRLLPSVTYNEEFVGWDSLAIFIWDTDDTCYVSVKGSDKDKVGWNGD